MNSVGDSAVSAGRATREQALRQAARTALAAPSIFNTQPWRWDVDASVLFLYADRDRQLMVADTDGRLLTVSCGVALHHARTALAAAGYEIEVQRMPDPADPDLLARITPVGEHRPTPQELHDCAAIPRRHTDRRPFTAEPVPAPVGQAMVAAAEAQGAHLHLVRDEQVSALAAAAARAGELQLSDPQYRVELAEWAEWTGRARAGSDAAPSEAAVRPTPRRVPVRDFTPFRGVSTTAGEETDRGAQYAVVFTDSDIPLAWLRAGEALSAVLLTAVGEGLGTSPISDVTELSVTREELRRLLAGIGYPQLAVRVGHAPQGDPTTTRRRVSYEVITP